ncbi:MAG: choline ABC transporter ATP-binding protein [Oleispira antarctica]|uniref:ABC-type proline/glycine betaine transport system, ATPase component n=1 Tax=Oleispira antarctica RB-8 TaxID=698738 RepID=R4YRL0_OLEAN|nr:choline ABC transporter ATP-binding protein [Oleispira antarctica]MBQ0792426.1 choline ABC transporter ATP-binding protein [Oleispira antarctica]CCK77727.1 ABC-type proline/glycine betaine transport system, ATPase component [Oleispira antarctica RB-8]|tara:strand:+ start:1988 stop:3196 length:1209 start_codon:yes stop_codon:yes gene_type:complete
MINIKNLDVIFGDQPERALALLDQGQEREEISNSTGLVVGVNNANLQISKGEICVLMGLSGSGKSSLLRCINGLNDTTRGSIEIDHEGEVIDLVSADADMLRAIRTKRMSMVFQKFALMPWLTVAQNVAMPLELQGLDKKEIKQRVDAQLELVGLEQWAKHKPSELSGGMQQRVGLARALVTESDILLMDEPFSALDPLIRTQLQDELIQLQEKLNKTIIFVSHDLDEALKLGTNIAIMKDGEIVQQGKPESIVLNPVNDYVKQFVAHTNPIHVLKAKSIMRPITDMEFTEKGYCLSKRHDYWLSASQQQVYYRGGEFSPQLWQTGQDIVKLTAAPTCVAADTGMQDVMEIRYHTDHAVFIMKDLDEDLDDDEKLHRDEKIQGVIGDKELYHTLLGKMMLED